MIEFNKKLWFKPAVMMFLFRFVSIFEIVCDASFIITLYNHGNNFNRFFWYEFKITSVKIVKNKY